MQHPRAIKSKAEEVRKETDYQNLESEQRMQYEDGHLQEVVTVGQGTYKKVHEGLNIQLHVSSSLRSSAVASPLP